MPVEIVLCPTLYMRELAFSTAPARFALSRFLREHVVIRRKREEFSEARLADQITQQMRRAFIRGDAFRSKRSGDAGKFPVKQ